MTTESQWREQLKAVLAYAACGVDEMAALDRAAAWVAPPSITARQVLRAACTWYPIQFGGLEVPKGASVPELLEEMVSILALGEGDDDEEDNNDEADPEEEDDEPSGVTATKKRKLCDVSAAVPLIRTLAQAAPHLEEPMAGCVAALNAIVDQWEQHHSFVDSFGGWLLRLLATHASHQDLAPAWILPGSPHRLHQHVVGVTRFA